MDVFTVANALHPQIASRRAEGRSRLRGGLQKILALAGLTMGVLFVMQTVAAGATLTTPLGLVTTAAITLPFMAAYLSGARIQTEHARIVRRVNGRDARLTEFLHPLRF